MARHADLTCREMVELVTDYLEGTLGPEDRARFEEHLAGCDGCVNYLEQMRTVLRLTGSLSEDAVPAGARDRLVETFRGWRSGLSPR